jgi:signal transduction histidine kinase
MTRLADQLLFLCREDAGVPIAAPPICVGGFVSELVDDLQPLAQERGLNLACRPLPACRVAIDPDRLRRLFCNVLDNALKYTPSGGAVSVSGTCRTDSVEIVVSDTGVGVSPELVPRLFQRFYRVPSTRVHAAGSGLGLAICQAIVDRHGGRIAIDSRPEGGIRVTVTLPTTSTVSKADFRASLERLFDRSTCVGEFAGRGCAASDPPASGLCRSCSLE